MQFGSAWTFGKAKAANNIQLNFSDVDQGYTVYQQMKSTAGAYNAQWIPADAPAH